MKKLTAFLCALFLLGNAMTPACSAYAETLSGDTVTEAGQEVTAGDLTFAVYGDHAVLTGCDTTLAEIIIPDAVEGVPVTEIGDYAFAGQTSIKALVVPATITASSETAFEETVLEKVFLETDDHSTRLPVPYFAVVYRYYHSYSGTEEYTTGFLNGMSYRKYSDHIEIVQMDYYLSEITVPAEIEGLPVTTVYSPTPKGLAGGFPTNSSLQTITIPETVTSLSLEYCTALTDIILEGDNPVLSVQDGVLFSENMSILEQYPLGREATSYIIPDSVTEIADSAFCMSKLESVTIPEGVTSIKDYAFCECRNLTDVTLPESLTSLGQSAFSSCIAMTAIHIPESLESVPRFAFKFCKRLSDVTLPDSLRSIEEAAFYGTAVTELVIPAHVTTIDTNAFTRCVSLASVQIPASVTEIGKYAFYGCTAMTGFQVDAANTAYCDLDGVLATKDMTTILEYPDSYPAAAYTIPACVSVINGQAFAECVTLESIVIPETVTSIGDLAFDECPNLQSAAILANTDRIGKYTFYACPKLSEITLTKSVRTIGFRAFTSLAETTEVYYLGSELDWNAITFEHTNDGLTEGNLHFAETSPALPLGDLSDDGTVDASDAAMLLVAAAAQGAGEAHGLTDEQTAAADLNADGTFDAIDAAYILQYAAYAGAGGEMTLEEFLANL